jgi:hypothetical protein
VAARHYRSPRAIQSLKVLLALTLRHQYPPTGPPGEEEMAIKSGKCPNKDGGRLISNGDGTSYCSKCGETFDDVPKT